MPGSNVLKCKTGQYKAIQSHTSHTITHNTQGYSQNYKKNIYTYITKKRVEPKVDASVVKTNEQK